MADQPIPTDHDPLRWGGPNFHTDACKDGNHIACLNPLCKCACHPAAPIAPTADELIAKLTTALTSIKSGVQLMVPEPQKTGFIEIVDVALSHAEEYRKRFKK